MGKYCKMAGNIIIYLNQCGNSFIFAIYLSICLAVLVVNSIILNQTFINLFIFFKSPKWIFVPSNNYLSTCEIRSKNNEQIDKFDQNLMDTANLNHKSLW